MIIVVPLRAVFAARRAFVGIEGAGAIIVVFKHQMEVTASFGGEAACRNAEIAQDRDFAGLCDGVHRVQPQPVETIFA